ncbi:MAG TPA: hypothetical protein VLL50_09640, partial [Usitatibacter sp.]|nr:hypothetical protein [Usitatibacter sp.]
MVAVLAGGRRGVRENDDSPTESVSPRREASIPVRSKASGFTRSFVAFRKVLRRCANAAATSLPKSASSRARGRFGPSGF